MRKFMPGARAGTRFPLCVPMFTWSRSGHIVVVVVVVTVVVMAILLFKDLR